MLNRAFIAVAIVIASPAFVSAQDIFWAFSSTSIPGSGFLCETTSAYIFSDRWFSFDTLDLNITTSDPDVIRFTGGEVFNPTFDFIGGERFDSALITIDAAGISGNLFLENITQNGVNSDLSPTLDPGFDNLVGANGAVLLARVDFEVVGGGGDITFGFSLGAQGAVQLPSNVLSPSFGERTLQFPGIPLTSRLGDVSDNGVVDFFDIAPFVSVLSSGGNKRQADCNQDCVVNFLDIAPFIAILTDQ